MVNELAAEWSNRLGMEMMARTRNTDLKRTKLCHPAIWEHREREFRLMCDRWPCLVLLVCRALLYFHSYDLSYIYIYEKKLIKTCGAVKLFEHFYQASSSCLHFQFSDGGGGGNVYRTTPAKYYCCSFFSRSSLFFVRFRYSLALFPFFRVMFFFFSSSCFCSPSDKFIFISAFHFGYYICLFNLMWTKNFLSFPLLLFVVFGIDHTTEACGRTRAIERDRLGKIERMNYFYYTPKSPPSFPS